MVLSVSHFSEGLYRGWVRFEMSLSINHMAFFFVISSVIQWITKKSKLMKSNRPRCKHLSFTNILFSSLNNSKHANKMKFVHSAFPVGQIKSPLHKQWWHKRQTRGMLFLLSDFCCCSKATWTTCALVTQEERSLKMFNFHFQRE